ncbi:hypothetical protein HZH68_015646 [Vespula germanica]|uniref:Uncharacterized protein n=1 Tax=Vespula germanica TaxID=30212 RepID=A0A834J549_VESGE|nr:hypothetical protein HZH68_015646 [Vespula germanica]
MLRILGIRRRGSKSLKQRQFHHARRCARNAANAVAHRDSRCIDDHPGPGLNSIPLSLDVGLLSPEEGTIRVSLAIFIEFVLRDSLHRRTKVSNQSDTIPLPTRKDFQGIMEKVICGNAFSLYDRGKTIGQFVAFCQQNIGRKKSLLHWNSVWDSLHTVPVAT